MNRRLKFEGTGRQQHLTTQQRRDSLRKDAARTNATGVAPGEKATEVLMNWAQQAECRRLQANGTIAEVPASKDSTVHWPRSLRSMGNTARSSHLMAPPPPVPWSKGSRGTSRCGRGAASLEVHVAPPSIGFALAC